MLTVHERIKSFDMDTGFIDLKFPNYIHHKESTTVSNEDEFGLKVRDWLYLGGSELKFMVISLLKT